MKEVPYKILVIDGDSSSLMFLDVNLSKFGYRVLTAETTEKGLLLANSERPDLIVCDLHTSNMDGVEFCWMIRGTSRIPSVPFILLTPSENPETHIQAYRSGVDAIVTKPVSIRTLLTRIETLLRRYEQILQQAGHGGEQRAASAPVVKEERGSEGSGKQFEGSLEAFPLIELVQFMNMAKKSGMLRLQHTGEQGEIGIKDGEVVFARNRDCDGEEALYRMVGWDSGRFYYDAETLPETQNIHKSTMKLILDCCKLLDMESIIVNPN